jgi:hypothetical protein
LADVRVAIAESAVAALGARVAELAARPVVTHVIAGLRVRETFHFWFADVRVAIAEPIGALGWLVAELAARSVVTHVIARLGVRETVHAGIADIRVLAAEVVVALGRLTAEPATRSVIAEVIPGLSVRCAFRARIAGIDCAIEIIVAGRTLAGSVRRRLEAIKRTIAAWSKLWRSHGVGFRGARIVPANSWAALRFVVINVDDTKLQKREACRWLLLGEIPIEVNLSAISFVV